MTLQSLLVTTTSSIRTVELSTDPTKQLAEAQSAVGGYIEPFSGPGWVAFLNEEGKLHGLGLNPLVDGLVKGLGRLSSGDYIVGDVLFVGPEDDEGDITALNDSVIVDLANSFGIEIDQIEGFELR